MNNVEKIPVQPVSLAGLSAYLTPPPPSGCEPPLCVLLHGFGAPGHDLVSLSRPLARSGFAFLFPAAPIDLGPGYMGGRAWWPIDWAAREAQIRKDGMLDLSEEVPDGMPEARAQIIHLLKELRAAGIGRERLVLGGFSQGAMLAMDVAVHLDAPPAALVLMSPTLVSRKVWERKAGGLKQLPVFMSHGRSDPTLPFAMSEKLRDLLTVAGADLTWTPFSGGHEIPPQVLGPLRDFLARGGPE